MRIRFVRFNYFRRKLSNFLGLTLLSVTGLSRQSPFSLGTRAARRRTRFNGRGNHPSAAAAEELFLSQGVGGTPT